MKLIAKRPCRFGGRQFYIGDEVPADLVADPKKQERLGVVAIANDESAGVSGEQSSTLYTQEQLDSMIAEAIDEAVNNTVAEMEQKQAELQQAVAELKETNPGAYDGIILIAVKGESDGKNEQVMSIPATPEEIQKTFAIMQLTVEEGAKEIAGVKSENVLILLHAADSRKTIKDAAKKQADNLSTTDGALDESTGGNESTGTNTEGADT